MKKTEKITVMTGIEASLHQMERFNPYQTGNGKFRNRKCDKKLRRQEGRRLCAAY